MSPKTTVALLVALILAGVFALAYTNNWLGLGEKPQAPAVVEQPKPTPEPRRPSTSQPTSRPAASPSVPDVVDKYLLGEGKEPLASADLIRLELDRPGKGRLVATREPRPAARWELVEPAQPKPDTAQLDDLVRSATEFKIAAVFPPGDQATPSDELAGLTSPVAVLTLTERMPAPATTQPATGPEALPAKPTERQFRLTAGGPDVLRPGRTYVRVSGGGAGVPAAGDIYAVDDDVRKKLDVDLAKLRGKALLELTSDQIQRVEVKSAGGGDQPVKGAFTLERVAAGSDGWVVSFVNDRGKAVRGAADGGKASGLAGALASMEVTAWGDHKPAATDLRLWGLAPEPKLTVKMVAQKVPATTQPGPAQETVIKFGLDREGGGKYACIEGRPDEYFIVANSALSSIDLDREELRDKRLLPAATLANISASDLVGLTVAGGAAGANPPAASLIKDAKMTWRMVAPVQCQADGEAVDKLVSKLTGLKVSQFEDEPTAVTTASLANPRLRITLDRGAGKPAVVVLIGGMSTTGKATIVKAGDVVARVETADLDGVLPDSIDRFEPLSLADKTVWTLTENAIRGVKRVDAQAGTSGIRTVLRLPDGGDWKLAEPVKMDADSEAVKALLTKFASLKARQRTALTAAAAGLDKPAATLEFTIVEKAATTQPTTQPKEITTRRTITLVGRGADVYCQADRAGPVFLVDPALLADANVELAGRKLLPKLESADKATRLLIDSKGPTGKVELVKGGDWRLRADPQVSIDAKKVEELITTVGGLTVVRYVDFNCRKPADYGLDKPAARVSITWPGAGENAESIIVTLLVSAKGDASGSFAMVENDGKVGLLSPADLAKIQRDWKAFEQGKEPAASPGPGPMGGPMGMPPGMRGMPPE